MHSTCTARRAEGRQAGFRRRAWPSSMSAGAAPEGDERYRFEETECDLSALVAGFRAKRVLVIGMGGGCDVFAALAVGERVRAEAPEGTQVLHGACNSERDTQGLPTLAPHLYYCTGPPVPLVPGQEGYGTINLELSCPRGPEGSPLLFMLPMRLQHPHGHEYHTAAPHDPGPALGGVVEGVAEDVANVTRRNLDAFLPALAKVGPDLVIGVDSGGDSISGGTDWETAPESGVDWQVLHAVRQSKIPFVHLVFGPGCDGETSEPMMRQCVSALAESGRYRGSFPLAPFAPTMARFASSLKPTRTPNLISAAVAGTLPTVPPPDGAAPGEEYVRVERHGNATVIPRRWLTIGLAFTYADA